MRNLKLIFLGLIVILASSCKEETVTTGVSIATVIKTDDHFYLKSDKGNNLYPERSNYSPAQLEDSMRVVAYYSLIRQGSNDDFYNYYINLLDLNEILTKPIFTFTSETTEEVKDSIGYDPVRVHETWFTDQYLNIEFEYPGGGYYIHYINLVLDEEDKTTEDGAIILELKHNANEDPYFNSQWSLASFDLTQLKNENLDPVNIYLRWKDKDGEYYNKELVFEYDQPEPMELNTQGRNYNTSLE